MDTFYLIHIKTIHLYQSPTIGVDRIGFPMDRNVRSIHLRSFIASLLKRSKFVEHKKSMKSYQAHLVPVFLFAYKHFYNKVYQYIH